MARRKPPSGGFGMLFAEAAGFADSGRQRLEPAPAPFGEGDVVIATLRDAAVDPGWQIRTARTHGARVAFLLPAVHSPTGRVLDPGRRQALARALDRLGITAIEDNTLADLTFPGARLELDESSWVGAPASGRPAGGAAAPLVARYPGDEEDIDDELDDDLDDDFDDDFDDEDEDEDEEEDEPDEE